MSHAVRLVRGSSAQRVLSGSGVAFLAIVALALPFVLSGYFVFQLTVAMVYSIAVLGLILLTGLNGQISLAHGVFMGVGAYVTSILVVNHGWSFWETLPVAAFLNLAVGIAIGVPALRLRGLYLAILTLSLAVVFPPLLKRADLLTGGVQGILMTPGAVLPPPWLGLSTEQYQFFAVIGSGALLLVFARNLVSSRIGRAIVAIRDNEIPAVTVGIDLARIKTLTFGISAMYAGLSGSFYALVIGYVSPDSFTVQLSINLLAGMVIGGLNSIWGSIVGGIILEYLPVYAQHLNQALTAFVYGVALIIFVYVLRGGFIAAMARLFALVVDIHEPVEGASESRFVADTTADHAL